MSEMKEGLGWVGNMTLGKVVSVEVEGGWFGRMSVYFISCSSCPTRPPTSLLEGYL